MDQAQSRSRIIWLAALLAIFAVLTDQVTKFWALKTLVPTVKYPVFGDFVSFQLLRNPGAAFSLGSSSTLLFTILSIVVLGGIIWWIVFGRVQSVPLAIILGIIAGGAIGNLIDRIVQPPAWGRGHVIDFINYNDWFIGNVADIWIVGGAIALVVWVFLTDSKTDD